MKQSIINVGIFILAIIGIFALFKFGVEYYDENTESAIELRKLREKADSDHKEFMRTNDSVYNEVMMDIDPNAYFSKMSDDEINNLSNEKNLKFIKYIMGSTLDIYFKLDRRKQRMVLNQTLIVIYGDEWINGFSSEKKSYYENTIYDCIKSLESEPSITFRTKFSNAISDCVVTNGLNK